MKVAAAEGHVIRHLDKLNEIRRAAALKDNPLLIQKIVAERLSDKMQIMMVPMGRLMDQLAMPRRFGLTDRGLRAGLSSALVSTSTMPSVARKRCASASASSRLRV